MKPTAFLLNTARGGLVNEADLLEALRTQTIAGAGLDVFEEEPPAPNNPLFGLDNVVVTPHAAGTDLQSRDDMAASAAQAIVDLSRGQWPAEKIVNPRSESRFGGEGTACFANFPLRPPRHLIPFHHKRNDFRHNSFRT